MRQLLCKILGAIDRRVLLHILFFKFVFFLTVFASIELIPLFREDIFERLISWPERGSPTWQSRLATWDAAHYLHLATHGYEAGEASCAFYPLWPAIIALGNQIPGVSPFWAGLVASNLLSIIGLYLFYQFAMELTNDGIADQALLLILVAPGALFLSFIYTEALFLALTLTYFRLAQQQCWGIAAIAAFLLPLCRAVGFLIIVPMAILLFQSKARPRQYLWLAAPILGYAAYFAFMHMSTGNSLEGFEAQEQFPTKPSVAKLFQPFAFLEEFARVTTLHASRGSLLDRVFFILLLVAAPYAIRLHPASGLFATAIGIISAVSTELISFTRHIITCFPIWIVLATATGKPGAGTLRLTAIALLASIQILLLIRYLAFLWVG